MDSSPHQLDKEACCVEGIIEPAVESAIPLQTRLTNCFLQVAPPNAKPGLEWDPEVHRLVEI
jgi:hypothetical protein